MDRETEHQLAIETVLPAGSYQIPKIFRREQQEYAQRRHLPWTKAFLDVEHRTIFGRTMFAWLFLFFFLLIFYTLLSIFYVFTMYMFMLTLSDERPRWPLECPGLSFAPHAKVNGEGLISFYEDIDQEIEPYAVMIDKFLDKYGIEGQDRFKECNKDSMYGYRTRQPCIFLKLNRVYDFKAVTYEQANDLPQIAPYDLYEYMMRLSSEERQQRIWVSCEVFDVDIEPNIIYVPVRYFDAADVFEQDFQQRVNETSPKDFKRIIGVKFKDIPMNDVIYVKCTAWAKNIKMDERIHGRGFIKFQLQIKSLKPK